MLGFFLNSSINTCLALFRLYIPGCVANIVSNVGDSKHSAFNMGLQIFDVITERMFFMNLIIGKKSTSFVTRSIDDAICCSRYMSVMMQLSVMVLLPFFNQRGMDKLDTTAICCDRFFCNLPII